mgnify:CR=1 FL=1
MVEQLQQRRRRLTMRGGAGSLGLILSASRVLDHPLMGAHHVVRGLLCEVLGLPWLEEHCDQNIGQGKTASLAVARRCVGLVRLARSRGQGACEQRPPTGCLLELEGMRRRRAVGLGAEAGAGLRRMLEY